MEPDGGQAVPDRAHAAAEDIRRLRLRVRRDPGAQGGGGQAPPRQHHRGGRGQGQEGQRRGHRRTTQTR